MLDIIHFIVASIK